MITHDLGATHAEESATSDHGPMLSFDAPLEVLDKDGLEILHSVVIVCVRGT